MPFIHVRYSGESLSVKAIEALRSTILDEMASTMHKVRDLTSVLIERVEGADWTVGGTIRMSAAHVEAIVTAGTNSEAEKAAFIAAVYGRLAELFGPNLSEATYVVVREVPSVSWGYGGRTQEARRLERDGAKA
ncbi:4-oxalocrotonate tautomerase [Fulvimarina manganoxydans]|uniref:4-oxalocrotonate tautomerase n=1 Tax=Fulvimarina manganoxydans TaxID=937218 RepID=A0A1W1YFW7_9HYPH|nr:hypothetical protein [Fulvimarina manganoxydans]SMC35019.1 4-oxalocrotonate tautomerase [Fulvimarina manganoxydans]